jgi:hypothetical protein
MSGRVHYPKDSVRRVVREHDDDYVIFRKVVLHRSGSKPKTQSAVLRVRFHFARHSARTNRILSGAVVPFIVAQPGFRSKTWMLGQKTGAFQGVYVWDSIDDAEYYWTSFPMKLMRWRAVEGSLSREIRTVGEEQCGDVD